MNDASKQLRLLVWFEMKRKDVTQAEMARRIGCSQKHVSAVLTGRSTLRVEVAELMLSTLGLDLVLDVKERDYPSPDWLRTLRKSVIGS